MLNLAEDVKEANANLQNNNVVLLGKILKVLRGYTLTQLAFSSSHGLIPLRYIKDSSRKNRFLIIICFLFSHF